MYKEQNVYLIKEPATNNSPFSKQTCLKKERKNLLHYQQWKKGKRAINDRENNDSHSSSIIQFM